MLVMAGLAEAQLHTIRNIGNREQKAKARYLAESAAELASYWAVTHGVGENSNVTDPAAPFLNALVDAAEEIGMTNCVTVDPATGAIHTCVGFEVIGRATETVRIGVGAPDYYSVPMKGTGDAAAECNDMNDANDSCNWSALRLGESVEIPLFYESDTDGNSVLDIVKPNFALANSFRLRIRAPCEAYETDPNACNSAGRGSRIELYPKVSAAPAHPFRHVEKDPVLMQWLISETAAAGTSTLIARDIHSGVKRPMPNIPINIIENTEISGGRINDASPSIVPAFVLTDFVVLENTYNGLDLVRVPQTIAEFLAVQTEPMLRLSLVGQPRRDDSFAATELTSADFNNPELDVPYLEYQLLTLNPVSDIKSVIRGFAEIGDFRKEVLKFRHRPTTLGGFALEQF